MLSIGPSAARRGTEGDATDPFAAIAAFATIVSAGLAILVIADAAATARNPLSWRARPVLLRLAPVTLRHANVTLRHATMILRHATSSSCTPPSSSGLTGGSAAARPSGNE